MKTKKLSFVRAQYRFHLLRSYVFFSYSTMLKCAIPSSQHLSSVNGAGYIKVIMNKIKLLRITVCMPVCRSIFFFCFKSLS